MGSRVAHSGLTYTVVVIALAALLTATVTFDVYHPTYFQTVAPEMLRATMILFGLVSVFLGLKLRQITQLNHELQHIIARDKLTDVSTRDHFFAALAAQPDREGVCLMVDIDHFKRVNDTHGHLVGDKVIARVAGQLRRSVRTDDIVCRFGGEEFAIFLADADGQHAREVSERIHQSIKNRSRGRDDGHVEVTVSIGGSNVKPARLAESALHEADQALYQAKHNGRNQTVFAPPEPTDSAAYVADAA
ncbi:MAG: GGDEF domain-containing protein [Pseudomonadota bacterium]